MDPQDVRKLLAVIQRPRDLAIVLVLLRTGMRIGELLSTTVSDINLAERRIEIFETQKNRVGRVVYLADDACRALAHWLEVRRWQTALIFSGHGGRPLSYEVVRSKFKRLLEQAELSAQGLYAALPAAHLCQRAVKRRHAAGVSAAASGA